MTRRRSGLLCPFGLVAAITLLGSSVAFAQPIRCGNGVVDAGETCDDGNRAGGDGCGATCLLEPGFRCASAGGACAAVCGDSIRAGAGRFQEACDDGNTRDGDGCNAMCAVEFGYACRDTTSNLAPNGDFVMGRAGFTSDYTFDDARNLTTGFGGGTPEGNFTVTRDPTGWNGAFAPFGGVRWADANGDGFAALFNGIGVRTAYQATIAVEAGRDYVVQFNVADWGGENIARGQVTSRLLITVDTVPVTPELHLRPSDGDQLFWDFVGGIHRAARTAGVVLRVVDSEPGDRGNDFALDGISFRAVSPMLCSALDTDGDGVPDFVEGPTRDTDGDGVPDFRDPDDDGDGVPTVSELGPGGYRMPRDSDGDGTPDYLDPDDDNDSVPTRDELGPGGSTMPRDTDMDGHPDYLDPDDDNDGIPTRVEHALDTSPNSDLDGDGLPSYRDLDSDGDGVPDSVEAGADPTHPANTDGVADGPDFLDRDSDNDCVPDSDPREAGANRTNPLLPSRDPNANCGPPTPVCDTTVGRCVAATTDAGTTDTGTTDTGTTDTGTTDTGTTDTGTTDVGASDLGSADAGVNDVGIDAGSDVGSAVDGGETTPAQRFTYAGDGFGCGVGRGAGESHTATLLALGAVAVAVSSRRRRQDGGAREP
jgi:cysteine-rich repeat protein